MKPIKKPIGMEDVKARLSTLWIVVMFNMLSADIFSFMLPASASDAPAQVTQAIMLAFAVVIEIPIAMIFLSRVLSHKANRLANIIASIITILFVVAGGSLTLHYLFFATIEVVTMLFIVRYAWKWTNQETGADQNK
jgi:Sec-independent protein secretion pathway component TatC